MVWSRYLIDRVSIDLMYLFVFDWLLVACSIVWSSRLSACPFARPLPSMESTGALWYLFHRMIGQARFGFAAPSGWPLSFSRGPGLLFGLEQLISKIPGIIEDVRHKISFRISLRIFFFSDCSAAYLLENL